MVTKNPGKQRKRIHKASLHKKQSMMICKVDKGFAKEIGKNKLGVKKGDEVKVMRGDSKGFTGKVARIDLKSIKVQIEGMKKKKVSGEEANVLIHPSNIMIIRGDMNDMKRQKFATKKTVSK